MVLTLWKPPVPSTAFHREARFKVLLGRTCALTFECEDSDDKMVSISLLFEGVEAFKCTYYYACTVEMIETAYDKVVDVSSSSWLTDIKTQLIRSERSTSDLRHLMIYFDDGPCYEFICRAFRAEPSTNDDNAYSST